MSETQVIEQEIMIKPLDLSQLKTVKWMESNYVFQQTEKVASTQYSRLKGFRILAWMFAPFEFMLISLYLFIHQLPWPQFILNIIYKIDRVIEETLEFITRKVEWWMDIVAVRLMRLRDSLEAVIDTCLSLVIFIGLQVLDLWKLTMHIALGFLMWLFFPIIWIANKILPHEKMIMSSFVKESSIAVVAAPSEEVDALSNSSECESDVSLISEAWKIGQVNRVGHRQSLNRVDIRATVEGRLRTAMYKRVKTQLAVMRKNSVHFKEGVTAYARNVFEPTIRPAFEGFFSGIVEKFNLAKYYDVILNWVETPLFVLLKSIWISIVEGVFIPKHKSRRTRSMRSESLRHRKTPIAASVPAIGLSQSTEPVTEEQPPVSPLEIFPSQKDDEDQENIRDSALASSIDDVTSDNQEEVVALRNDVGDIDSEEEDFLKKAIGDFRQMKRNRNLTPMTSSSPPREPEVINSCLSKSKKSEEKVNDSVPDGLKERKRKGKKEVLVTKKIAFKV